MYSVFFDTGSENIAVDDYSSESGKKFITFKFNEYKMKHTVKFCQFKILNDNSNSTELQVKYEDGR